MSLLECLVRQNLTEFMNLLIRSAFFDLISAENSNVSITVFAPTNAAFDAVRSELVNIDPDMVIGNHIVLGTVKESDLVPDRRFMNLAGLILHGTTASFPNTNSLTYYNPQFTNVRQLHYIMLLMMLILLIYIGALYQRRSCGESRCLCYCQWDTSHH